MQDDVQGIAVSSYQGGHVEYFTYLLDRLREQGRGDIKVYGGGGGVIVPAEIEELHRRGVTRILSPQDGQQLGLAPMINTMIEACDVPPHRDGAAARPTPVVGMTGTGGSGKSSLTDELLRRFRLDQADKVRIAVIAIDPSAS